MGIIFLQIKPGHEIVIGNLENWKFFMRKWFRFWFLDCYNVHKNHWLTRLPHQCVDSAVNPGKKVFILKPCLENCYSLLGVSLRVFYVSTWKLPFNKGQFYLKSNQFKVFLKMLIMLFKKAFFAKKGEKPFFSHSTSLQTIGPLVLLHCLPTNTSLIAVKTYYQMRIPLYKLFQKLFWNKLLQPWTW